MDAITLSDLGGSRVDASPLTNPQTQISAAQTNTLMETTCQASFTSSKTTGTFTCTATAAPTTVSAGNVSHSSHWGAESATKPTISKTATGRYTLTFPASWVNGNSSTESISLSCVLNLSTRTGGVTDDLYAEVLSFATNVVTLKVESPKGTLADQGNNSSSDITIDWSFR